MLAWGVFMSAFNFVFVDQVLPRSNARLRSLLIDIGRKKPTFELREQVINEVPPSQYFLRATGSTLPRGGCREVTIYDVGGDASRRIIYADSGLMAYAEGQTDLSLRLFDGTIHQYRPTDPTGFQLTYFKVNDIRVKNVFDELERNTSETIRGDREMSTCEMLVGHPGGRRRPGEGSRTARTLLLGDLRALLALPALGPTPADPTEASRRPTAAGSSECRALISPRTAERPDRRTAGARTDLQRARARACSSRCGSGAGARRAQVPAPADRASPGQPVLQVAAASQQARPHPQARRPPALNSPKPRPSPGAPAVQLGAGGHGGRPGDGRRPPGGPVPVEVHKKWAISMACISFVIIGIVMALAVPAGRHRAGDRRRPPDLLGALRRAHRRGEPGRPRPRLPLGGDVDAEHRPHHPRADRAWSG